MEINESDILEKSHHDHQVVRSITENQGDLLQGSSYSKSYTCSFCKRGFSNAQALGGHMNIHRKDRARLRQAFADEVQLSLDITSSASNSVDHDHNHCSQDSDDKSTIEPNEDHRRNEDDAVHPTRDRGEKIRKQPLSVDAKLESPEPSGDEKIQSRSHDLPPNETLDLELRL